MSDRHLWEYDRDTVETGSGHTELSSFEALAALLECADPATNVIYRWDWLDGDLTVDPEDHDTLAVYWVDISDSRLRVATAPVDRAQEALVRQWLASPRVLGRVLRLWAPLLEPARSRVVGVVMPQVRLPAPYANEAAPIYRARVYRWRCWLYDEPGPVTYYASENEVRAYQAWRDSRPELEKPE